MFTEYGVTSNSKVCIITAGTIRNEGEEEVDWAQRNVAAMKEIIPNVLKYNKEPVILVLSSPGKNIDYFKSYFVK